MTKTACDAGENSINTSANIVLTPEHLNDFAAAKLAVIRKTRELCAGLQIYDREFTTKETAIYGKECVCAVINTANCDMMIFSEISDCPEAAVRFELKFCGTVYAKITGLVVSDADTLHVFAYEESTDTMIKAGELAKRFINPNYEVQA